MPSGGQIGSGVKVAYAITSPNVWVPITQLMDVSIPSVERDRVKTTVHGVTSLNTYIPGLGEVSDLELTVLANLDASGVHTALKNYERSQTTLWFRIEVPNESNLATAQYVATQIQGRVAKWVLNTPIDAEKSIDIAIQFEDNYMYQNAMASAIS